MIHFFVFSRRSLTSRFLLITSLEPEQFHAITHSFPRRHSAKSFSFNTFRTLFIAIGGGTPLSTSVQKSELPRFSHHHLFSYSYELLFPQLLSFHIHPHRRGGGGTPRPPYSYFMHKEVIARRESERRKRKNANSAESCIAV